MKLVYKFLLPTILILVGGFYFLLDKTVTSQNEVIDFLQGSSNQLLMHQLKQREKSELDLQNHFLNFSANSMASLSANFVVNYDTDGLSNELKNFFEIKAIRVIAVFDNLSDEYFMVVHRQGDQLFSNQILPGFAYKYKTIKKEMFFDGSTTAKDKLIGFVVLYYDESFIQNEIVITKQNVINELKKFTIEVKNKADKSTQGELYTASIILLVTIFLIVILSYAFVLNPLNKLKNGLNNFFLFLQNKRNSTQNIDLHTNDEFGQMARSLNENIAVSTKLHKEIKDLNSHLEEKVDNRTKELKKQKETFEAIYNGSKDAISILNLDSLFLSVNPAFIEMTGFSERELLATSCLELTIEKHRVSLKEALSDVLNVGYIKNFEIDFCHKENKIITLNLSMSFLQDPDRILISVRDISKNKELEKKLIESKHRAEESTRAKSEFLANMSHEIRTPMNGIIGMSHLALQTELNDKQKNFVQKIDSSAKSLLGIINDILDFSKIEAGKLSIEKINFDLYKLIDNVINLIEFKAHEKDLEIIVSYEKNVGKMFFGDSLRISQILTNLLSNAVKFTSSGEIGIYIHKSKNNKVRFEVKDTGIGLTPDQQKKLFQSFSQADGSTTRKYGGTGLGLSISKQLVELMGGKIWVESEYRVGSRFIFDIELIQLESIAKEKLRFKNKKVLIVDDNPVWQEILTTLLSRFSLNIDVANNGYEALEVMKKGGHQYDLILMDWNMPQLDGIETTQMLHKNCAIENIPTVIMISAFKQESIVKLAHDVGIDVFLQKPINPSLLDDIIIKMFHHDVRYHYSKQETQNKPLEEQIKILKGSKILLVEDNEVNQELVLGILEPSGMQIDLARNGQEAIAQFKLVAYELILMDIQMPVMDGYEATKIIRKMNKDVPIIALTANAMTEDIEKTQQAGMNEHLNKPIHFEKLFEKLLKYISPKIALESLQIENNGSDKTQEITQDSANASIIPEFKTIDSTIGLQHCINDKELFLQVLVTFLSEYRDFNLDNVNDVEFKRSIHTLKGLSANIGALSLYEICKTLEESQDKNLLGVLSNELQSVIDELQAKLGPELLLENEVFISKENDKKIRISMSKRDDLFAQLKLAVSTKRPKNCKAIIDDIREYTLSPEDEHVFQKVKKLIEDYEYSQANELLG